MTAHNGIHGMLTGTLTRRIQLEHEIFISCESLERIFIRVLRLLSFPIMERGVGAGKEKDMLCSSASGMLQNTALVSS